MSFEWSSDWEDDDDLSISSGYGRSPRCLVNPYVVASKLLDRSGSTPDVAASPTTTDASGAKLADVILRAESLLLRGARGGSAGSDMLLKDPTQIVLPDIRGPALGSVREVGLRMEDGKSEASDDLNSAAEALHYTFDELLQEPIQEKCSPRSERGVRSDGSLAISDEGVALGASVVSTALQGFGFAQQLKDGPDVAKPSDTSEPHSGEMSSGGGDDGMSSTHESDEDVNDSEMESDDVTEPDEVSRLFELAKDVWTTVDTNTNNALDRQEFANLLKALNIGMEALEQQNTFDKFDTDGDGELDFDEFQRLLLRLSERDEIDAIFQKLCARDPGGKMTPKVLLYFLGHYQNEQVTMEEVMEILEHYNDDAAHAELREDTVSQRAAVDSDDVVRERVVERQRLSPLGSWSGKAVVSKTDGYAWENVRTGVAMRKEEIILPIGWVWDDDWHVDVTGSVPLVKTMLEAVQRERRRLQAGLDSDEEDEDPAASLGWEYAFDFPKRMLEYSFSPHYKWRKHFVRRRTWTRTRRFAPGEDNRRVRLPLESSDVSVPPSTESQGVTNVSNGSLGLPDAGPDKKSGEGEHTIEAAMRAHHSPSPLTVVTDFPAVDHASREGCHTLGANTPHRPLHLPSPMGAPTPMSPARKLSRQISVASLPDHLKGSMEDLHEGDFRDVETVFENERLNISWSSRWLVKRTDGYHFSDVKGNLKEKASVTLPKGWRWTGPWMVEMQDAGGEGWRYAFDFPKWLGPNFAWSPKYSRLKHFVRRRMWFRVRVFAPTNEDRDSDESLLKSKKTDGPTLTKEGFRALLTAHSNNVLEPARDSVFHDMERPLSHYWIASSHNTYCTGDQIIHPASTEPYKTALLLGCRCVELDVFDGSSNKPIIYHGHTRMKPVDFISVVAVIAQYAFVSSEFPLILSLENHCSRAQRDVMADVFDHYFGDMLAPPSMFQEGDQLPSPAQLKFKILLKGKAIAVKASEAPAHKSSARMISRASRRNLFDDEEVQGESLKSGELKIKAGLKKRKVYVVVFEANLFVYSQSKEKKLDCLDLLEENVSSKKNKLFVGRRYFYAVSSKEAEDWVDALNDAKLGWLNSSAQNDNESDDGVTNDLDEECDGRELEPLSKMIHLQTASFRSHQECFARAPWIMTSFTEGHFSSVTHPSFDYFRAIGSKSMLRSYPKGSRFYSSNYDPVNCWQAGVQMVALNYQTPDHPMLLNQGFFRDNGGCGYVLKPPAMLSEGPDLSSLSPYKGDDGHATFFPTTADTPNTSDARFIVVDVLSGWQLPLSGNAVVSPFVAVSVDSPHDRVEWKSAVVANNGLHPVWRQRMVRRVHTPSSAILVLAVHSNGKKKSNLLGYNSLPLLSARWGFRLVPLMDPTTHQQTNASLLCRITVLPPVRVSKTTIVEDMRAIVGSTRMHDAVFTFPSSNRRCPVHSVFLPRVVRDEINRARPNALPGAKPDVTLRVPYGAFLLLMEWSYTGCLEQFLHLTDRNIDRALLEDVAHVAATYGAPRLAALCWELLRAVRGEVKADMLSEDLGTADSFSSEDEGPSEALPLRIRLRRLASVNVSAIAAGEQAEVDAPIAGAILMVRLNAEEVGRTAIITQGELFKASRPAWQDTALDLSVGMADALDVSMCVVDTLGLHRIIASAPVEFSSFIAGECLSRTSVLTLFSSTSEFATTACRVLYDLVSMTDYSTRLLCDDDIGTATPASPLPRGIPPGQRGYFTDAFADSSPRSLAASLVEDEIVESSDGNATEDVHEPEVAKCVIRSKGKVEVLESATVATRISTEDPRQEEEDDKVLMEGYLLKQGGDVSHWRKRWFSLTKSHLKYRSKQESDAKTSIVVPMATAKLGNTSPLVRSFTVVRGGRERSLHLACETERAYRGWLEHLTSTLKHARASTVEAALTAATSRMRDSQRDGRQTKAILTQLYERTQKGKGDVVIVCKEKSGRVYAHKAVLSARSRYFANLLSHQEDSSRLSLTSLPSPVVGAIVSYLYTDSLPQPCPDPAAVAKAAGKMKIRRLLELAGEALVATMDAASAKEVGELAKKLDLKELAVICQAFKGAT